MASGICAEVEQDATEGPEEEAACFCMLCVAHLRLDNKIFYVPTVSFDAYFAQHITNWLGILLQCTVCDNTIVFPS